MIHASAIYRWSWIPWVWAIGWSLKRWSNQCSHHMLLNRAGFKSRKNWQQVLNPEIVEPSSIRGRFWKVFRDLNLSGLMVPFDSCQCNSLSNILKVYCMPTKIMNLIKVLCQSSAWTVKVNGNMHKWVNQIFLPNTDSFIQNPFVRHWLYYKKKKMVKIIWSRHDTPEKCCTTIK